MSENIEYTGSTESTVETQANIVQPKKSKVVIYVIVGLSLVVLGLLICIFVLFNKAKQMNNAPQQLIVDTRVSETDKIINNPLANRNITFVGYDAAVLEEADTILLENCLYR